MDILLVAKPWKGALAHYLFAALSEMFPDRVRWIPTYPVTAAQRVAYLRDRRSWRRALAAWLDGASYRAAIFVNTLEAFRELRNAERNVLWLTDAARLGPEDAAPFQSLYVSDPGYREDLMRATGRSAEELPFAHHPSVHHPVPAERGTPREVCFIGNRDPARDAYLARLIDSELRSTIVGNYFLRTRLYWRRPGCFRQRIPYRHMGAVYARHRTALNVHAQVVRAGTNMRSFECAGYGIAQVADWRPGLDRLFEPERELLVCRSPEQMLEQLRRLLAHPGEAHALATRARARSLGEHTYNHRVYRLLQHLVPQSELALWRPAG